MACVPKALVVLLLAGCPSCASGGSVPVEATEPGQSSAPPQTIEASGGNGADGSAERGDNGTGDPGDAGNGGSADAPKGTAGGDAGADAALSSSSFCLKAGSGDYAQPGPYTVATKSVDLASYLSGASPPTTFTIFYPLNMEANCPHPGIVWGNGTGISGSSTYAFFNNNAASWGMVVVASDNPDVLLSPFFEAGISYLLAQNKDATSEFYQKLGTQVGVSGHSQGAIAATSATSDTNVGALVQVEGWGTTRQGVPALVLAGTADDVVGTQQPTATYDQATGPAMLAIYQGADHLTTPTSLGWSQTPPNPGSVQFMRLYTAWFRCFLGEDPVACATFKGGKSCGICSDPNWATLETKNM